MRVKAQEKASDLREEMGEAIGEFEETVEEAKIKAARAADVAGCKKQYHSSLFFWCLISLTDTSLR